jgi:hypothetical protein
MDGYPELWIAALFLRTTITLSHQQPSLERDFVSRFTHGRGEEKVEEESGQSVGGHCHKVVLRVETKTMDTWFEVIFSHLVSF